MGSKEKSTQKQNKRRSIEREANPLIYSTSSHKKGRSCQSSIDAELRPTATNRKDKKNNINQIKIKSEQETERGRKRNYNKGMRRKLGKECGRDSTIPEPNNNKNRITKSNAIVTTLQEGIGLIEEDDDKGWIERRIEGNSRV